MYLHEVVLFTIVQQTFNPLTYYISFRTTRLTIFEYNISLKTFGTDVFTFYLLHRFASCVHE